MLKRLLRQNETYLAVLIVLLGAIITIANPRFLTAENIFGFLKSYSMVGIMAVGTLFVLILGGTPDVSFTAIAQVVEYAVVAATLAWGGNIYLAILAAALMGAVMGLANGLIVHYFRVPTIIVTIATFNIFFGLMYVITRGKLINDIPRLFKDFGNVLLFPATSAIGGTYGLSSNGTPTTPGVVGSFGPATSPRPLLTGATGIVALRPHWMVHGLQAQFNGGSMFPPIGFSDHHLGVYQVAASGPMSSCISNATGGGSVFSCGSS